jgi:hypothetical protein
VVVQQDGIQQGGKTASDAVEETGRHEETNIPQISRHHAPRSYMQKKRFKFTV